MDNLEPISGKMSKNPYMEPVPYCEFLSLIAGRLEDIKGNIDSGVIHEIINIQGLLLNQVRIIQKNG